jgi:hypothetical protein
MVQVGVHSPRLKCPIAHLAYSVDTRVTQPLFPLTIRSLSTISKGDDSTPGVKGSYPLGNRPSKKRPLAHRNIEFLTECL